MKAEMANGIIQGWAKAFKPPSHFIAANNSSKT
jgi:hypothetical protein